MISLIFFFFLRVCSSIACDFLSSEACANLSTVCSNFWNIYAISSAINLFVLFIVELAMIYQIQPPIKDVVLRANKS